MRDRLHSPEVRDGGKAQGNSQTFCSAVSWRRRQRSELPRVAGSHSEERARSQPCGTAARARAGLWGGARRLLLPLRGAWCKRDRELETGSTKPLETWC